MSTSTVEVDAKVLAALISDEALRALRWHADGRGIRHPLWKAVRAAESLRKLQP